MKENITDDPEFWFEAGVDYTSKTWRNFEIISTEDITALGKIFVQQGAPRVVPEEPRIEQKYPALVRKG